MTTEAAERGTKTETGIMDEQTTEAAMPTHSRGAKVGVKSARDVAEETKPAGPLIRYGTRPTVREGAKVGYRGETEGLVESRGDVTAAEAKSKVLAEQATGPFAPGGRAKSDGQPDFLESERGEAIAPPATDPSPPDASSTAVVGSLPATDPAKTAAGAKLGKGLNHDELDAIAAAEGADLSGATTKAEKVKAIETHRAGS